MASVALLVSGSELLFLNIGGALGLPLGILTTWLGMLPLVFAVVRMVHAGWARWTDRH